MPDRQQLVRALLQLYDQPALRRQLATRALAHAKAHYSWDAVAEQLIQELLPK